MQISLVSWNVNGIRAVSAKDEFKEWFAQDKYDVISMQETKASVDQIPEHIASKDGYSSYFSSSVVKKGYSGTAVYSKIQPLNVEIELPDPAYQGEGRIVHLEFEQFHFFNGYFPNGGAEIEDENGKGTGEFKRVPYKMGFFDSFFNYVQELRKSKPIVVCGDFNIAHKEIDLARPKTNTKNTGFLPLERAFLDKFTQAGYIDTFRHVHGDKPDNYTWWSYKSRARAKNVGWRIDYFFVSEELKDNIADAYIENEVYGSDHCPVALVLDFK
ncbi:Exodeoxyribonuclease [Anaerobiospirillum thomasii]|uniref:exodeoxyribonuclease III n=1 Tax=Anaerobiospirillum thomasii TaxID=179995 RepID=UPI000D945252|nr:exodeoxyribonuclease III [Anaerobiospirillum thomasii]SPT71493.1 Exodeoxyribonuclease [Anaerobiospirillum thomasii]